MKTDRILALVALTGGLLATGCVSHHETVYRDEPRMKVEFENDTAGRIFYEALSKSAGRLKRSESETEVSIPIIFEHKQRTVSGENAAFNDAVRRCDTNQNGTITEQEARIFADQP